MTAFISIYILLGAVCVCLLSAETVFNVSKPVGSTAALLCNLTSVDIEKLYIKWQIKSKPSFKTVFERLGEEAYQAEGYEGRVDVPVEKLRKGDCALVLHNLTLTDTGVYTSYQALIRRKRAASVTMAEISRVFLSVYDRTEEINPPDKAEERSGDKSDSSGNGGWKRHHLWLILPGLVLAVLAVVVVVQHLKRRNIN